MKFSSYLPASAPARWFALGLLVNSFGTGLYSSVLVIYFVSGVHLEAAQVGLVTTIGAGAGLAAAPAAGALLDRCPVVKAGTAFLCLEAIAMLSLTIASSLPVFGIGAFVAASAAQGSKVARGVLTAHIAPPAERGRVRAQLRSSANLGLAAGTGVAAGVIAIVPVSELRWLFVANAATFLVLAAVYLTKLPPVEGREDLEPSTRQPGHGSLTAWTDRCYMAVMSMNGLLGVQYAAITVGIPVLVTMRPELPDWLVPLSLLLNTLVVVTTQVPLSARIKGAASAGRCMLAAGIVLGASSGSFALLSALDGHVAVSFLLLLVVVHSMGEVLQVSGSFDLSYDLADPRFLGSYQAVYSWTAGTGSALGPGFWSAAVAAGTAGFAPLVGVGFAAAGAVAWMATRRIRAD
jgi:hypothetical protein